MNKRVKIVATLGPAVEIRGGKKFGEDGYWSEKLDPDASAKNIAQLIEEGANVFRFNFSHGDHQEQGERMATVKRAEEIASQLERAGIPATVRRELGSEIDGACGQLRLKEKTFENQSV